MKKAELEKQKPNTDTINPVQGIQMLSKLKQN